MNFVTIMSNDNVGNTKERSSQYNDSTTLLLPFFTEEDRLR